MAYIPDFKARAKELLLSQYRNDEFLQAYAKALGTVAQELEDAMFDAIVSSRLDTATGDYLDQWGDVVGEARGTLDDEAYRRLIVSKIRSNRSNGLPEEIDRTITAGFDQSNYEIERLSPATARITVFSDRNYSDEFVRRVSNIIESSFAAGVTVEIVLASVDANLTFDKAAPLSLDSGLMAKQVH